MKLAGLPASEILRRARKITGLREVQSPLQKGTGSWRQHGEIIRNVEAINIAADWDYNVTGLPYRFYEEAGRVDLARLDRAITLAELAEMLCTPKHECCNACIEDVEHGMQDILPHCCCMGEAGCKTEAHDEF